MVFKVRNNIERTRTAKELRTCKQRYDNLVSKISVGIYILHSVPEGTFTLDYVSPRMAEMLNASVESLLADSRLFFHYIHPDDLTSFVTLNQEGIQQLQPFDWEGRFLVEGTVTWLHFKSSPELLENGDVLWRGVVTDTTGRKRTEEALRESEERYRAQFNRAVDGIYILSPDGTLVEVNESLARMHGYTVQELRQINLKDLETPGTSRLAPERIRRLLAGEALTFEVEHYHKDGHVFPLEVSASLIFSGGGSYIQSFHRDITERREHEKEQLKIEKLKSLGLLAGGIAHDFNNILTVIKGNMSFAQIFIDATHKSYKPLLEAEKASVRAAELAHQLLTFARGGDPVKQVVSLRQLVSETVSLVLHGSNVMGIVDIPDSIHAIDADEGQMNQVFHNIIINAMQGMPHGGTLTVTAQNENLYNANTMNLPGGSYVRLSFSDQGCGISDGDMKRIFDPYFTTKPSGNGLGLASVHSIVNRHGGHIGASSVVGKGTTFCIHLPSISETYSKSLTDSDSMPAGKHTGGSILVMDDEKMIRDMTTGILGYLGYQVTTCRNGAEAIARYKTASESGTPFSAVIMDLTIPGGMGGAETAQQVLVIDPKACLIVSSGYSNDPVMAVYGTYGFKGAVTKPYDINELGHLLTSLLSKQG